MKGLKVIVASLALAVVGCNVQSNNLFKNLTAAQCDNQSQVLSQLPTGFLTPAQAAMAVAGACAALYGTQVAPTTATGNTSVFGDVGAPPAPAAK